MSDLGSFFNAESLLVRTDGSDFFQKVSLRKEHHYSIENVLHLWPIVDICLLQCSYWSALSSISSKTWLWHSQRPLENGDSADLAEQ